MDEWTKAEDKQHEDLKEQEERIKKLMNQNESYDHEEYIKWLEEGLNVLL